MRAVSLISRQLVSIHTLIHECADDLTETEWTRVIYPQINPLGFTCWHIVRTWDWALQTCILGVPEVNASDRFAHWSRLGLAGFGAGVSSEQTHEIAQVASRVDVLAYADMVYANFQDWLSSLSDDDLDTVPAMGVHMAAYPAYQLPGSREETDDLLDQPISRLLNGPCLGHLRGHLGEAGVLKQILRANVEHI